MIATANVIAYFDTGFSGIDCPAEPAILTASPNQVTLSVINCLPLSGQANVTIRVKKFSKLSQTDYISLQFSDDNIRYFAQLIGYKYLTTDTVELYLEMDYLLSAGGVSNIKSISGITQRVHVSKTDDKLFKYIEPDELIVPNNVLQIETKEVDFEPQSNPSKDYHIIVSTLDLFAIGLVQIKGGKQAEVLLSNDTNDKIVLPKLYSLDEFDYDNEYNGQYKFSEGKSRYGSLVVNLPTSEKVEVTKPNVAYFDADDPAVSLGVSRVHECGAEDCILESYTLPGKYVENVYTTKTPGENGRIELETRQNGVFELSNDLPVKYAEARNNKIFSGECNSYTFYGMASNDSMSFKPETIASEQIGASQPGGTREFLPYFLFIDPRKSGGLMCGPHMVNGNYNRWYNNYVRSLEFQNLPITFIGASGSLINGIQSRITNINTKNTYEAQYPIDGYTLQDKLAIDYNWIEPAANMLTGGINMITGGLTKDVSGALSGFGQMAGSLLDSNYNDDKVRYIQESQLAALNLYSTKLATETALMGIRSKYVAPQPKFQTSETIREIIGNGFCIMKYKMTDDDIKRIDKLLTMYGYRLTKSLEHTDLKNRPAFNFIKATDVHITTVVPIPKWLREGVEGQLMGGCRLWHKMYDISELENNETYENNEA